MNTVELLAQFWLEHLSLLDPKPNNHGVPSLQAGAL